MRESHRERGEGKLGSIIGLVVVAGILYAGFNVGPVYLANYALVDKVAEIARTPRGAANDEKIYDLLMKYVRDEGLSSYITRDSFRVTTLEGHRTVTLNYSRTMNILPGFPKTVVFNSKIDQLLPY